MFAKLCTLLCVIQVVKASHFTQKNATFTVPPGVTSVRALVVGGGAGGASGFGSGGGSGYVITGELNVNPLTQIKVIVGRGGRGSTMKMNDNSLTQNGGGGGRSTFGSLLFADGAIALSSYNSVANGGSGGGGGWGSGASGTSGAGGTDGGKGGTVTGGPGGTGQGSFSVALQKFKYNNFTAGNGGRGATGILLGGGGGGGVLMNGDGPSGGMGQFGDAYGGVRYGAGGAGGKVFSSNNLGNPCYAGGDGADGLVYIEW